MALAAPIQRVPGAWCLILACPLLKFLCSDLVMCLFRCVRDEFFSVVAGGSKRGERNIPACKARTHGDPQKRVFVAFSVTELRGVYFIQYGTTKSRPSTLSNQYTW